MDRDRLGEAVTELSDEQVFGKPQEMSDDQVFGDRMPDALQTSVPEAFLDRVRAGQVLSRITMAAIQSGKEGLGTGTPTGFEDETLNHLIDLGIFHDPASGRGGPIQMANEAVLMPAAQLWEGITRATSAGIHGAGGAFGQLVEEFGSSEGHANRAKNEIINFGNWAMIEAGMGRFSRPAATPQGVLDQPVGGLPRAEDFSNAGKVMESPHAEANLKRMWSEDGIHPAEAVHDAQADAFLKHEITAPRIAAEPPKLTHWESRQSEEGPAHLLNIETAGKNTGYISLTEREGGKELYIDNTSNEGRANASGPAFVRSLIPQLREMFPDAEFVSGYRSSGAREKADLSIEDSFTKVRIRPKAEEPVVVGGYPIPREDFDALEETGGKPGDLGAAATDPPDVSPAVSPTRPPGSLAATFKAAGDTLFDIGRDAQMLTAPMARGTTDSMAIAKDFANSLRRNRWDWSRMDKDIADRFTPEQRARMWTAADEESVSLQLGEPAHMREHQGLATLTPAERAVVEEQHARAQNAWVRARDVGMVEGEGLPAYTPRMIINAMGAGSKETALALDGIGRNLKTKTANMLKRKYLESQETEAAAKAKYGDEAMLARDIRVLPLATSQLEDAIAGRTLINNIKAYGEKTGADTVVEGAIPVGGDTKWFTLDHPAFRTWRPKFQEVDGKVEILKDTEGKTVFEQVPLYVHGDFEGPLRAVLSQQSGPLYGGMMALKGKTMSLIMNSPMIHNAVEWGRALPAMPGKVATFKVYFEGNRAKNNVPLMHEAIDSGLVPIGHRFFNQDITSIMESPDLTPGRSWTAKVLGFVPGLFDEGAGTAVKTAIDKAGDFWHNTLLWDRIADLQMGLYVNFRADAIAKGIDPQTSSRMAAHFANRYAGALPKEAMSDAATKVANMLMFSRSFTMGNLGVIKDMLTGLPKDVLAQIERDVGEVNPTAAGYAKSLARRKAMTVVAADMALMYIGNSLLQNAFNVMTNDSTLEKEYQGYATRFLAKMQAVKEHPLELVQPLRLLSDLSSTSENEPGKQERIHIGNAADGTAIYMRNPAGKIGEEFIGYMTGPLDMMRRKLGTIARPVWQVMSNDKGFGRKIYDPDADTPGKYLSNMGKIAAHIAGSQLPEGQIGAFSDLVKGEGDKKVAALQALGPFAGVTFAKGAPGGMAVGEMYANKSQFEFRVNQAMPDIRRQILRGDIPGAQKAMTGIGMDASYQGWVVKTTLNPATRLGPKALRDFYRTATPEQRARMERAQQAPAQP
jgi:hypothetical protein